MQQSKTILFALFAIALLGSSCKPWKVVRQANPAPYSPSSQFALGALTFNNLRIGNLSRGEYMQKKSPADRKKWGIIFADMRQYFSDNLLRKASGVNLTRNRPSGQMFTIRANIGFLYPGVNAVVFARPSHVIVRVMIMKGGKVLDEMTLETKTVPSLTQYPTIASRLRNDAKKLGFWAGKYIKSRVIK